MIDYDKLRIAHELAYKYPETLKITLINNHQNSSKCFFSIVYNTDMEWMDFENIDELITKLKELTQTKPKYKVGDEVWGLTHGKEIFDLKIERIAFGYKDIEYHQDTKGWVVYESEIYPTKQALIEAQIEYWTCLRNEEKLTQYEDMSKECQHESDNYSYITNHQPQEHSKKCLKCGYFYR